MLANTLHILMEFCEGGSLQQVLSRRERNEESFDEEEVFDWFIQIAKALMHVHDAYLQQQARPQQPDSTAERTGGPPREYIEVCGAGVCPVGRDGPTAAMP